MLELAWLSGWWGWYERKIGRNEGKTKKSGCKEDDTGKLRSKARQE
jgi:hypothetical protein